MEQLAFFPEIDDKEYKLIQKAVVKVLRDYKALAVRMENQTECERESIQLFPELRDTRKLNDYKYLQIKRALDHSLDLEQREIIERKYLKGGVMNDTLIKTQMMLEHKWYYYQKKSAIMAIATALRMI
ncbi:ArpU family transcriptional regulator [Bacillus wiedmannii]|uniref:ArpU family phage packaging/lysis transcriptional regulator n=1 Tax=Bacillus wiedmannii TaxID=1890302 RepID=UPI0021D12846|nr:ArpU family phage packaging/lysis transcriptional regulator [Bacillus wiedmannii]MCU5414820.1 ArpU family transcriptional regulator [Bacillus wiedmannii]